MGSSTALMTGTDNFAAGEQALMSNVSGGSNIAIGPLALGLNRTGFRNIALGEFALSNNLLGQDNIALGSNALSDATSSNSNVAIGDSALANSTTPGNVAVGAESGWGVGGTNMSSVGDTFVTFLGYRSSRDGIIPGSTSLNNITAIGNNAKVGISNGFVLGGTSTNAVNVGIGTTSPTALLTIRSQVGSASTSLLIASSTGATMLTLLSSGNLALGTSSASSRFDIYQNTQTSNIDLFRILTDVGSSGNVKFRIDSDGDVFTDGGTTIGNPADVAENYSAEEPLQPGTVVALASSTSDWELKSDSATSSYRMAKVRTAKNGDSSFGVVSTKPGITLGANTPDGTPVALSGRVPVKVTNESGVIKKGDFLTLSTSSPGYAMKMTETGRTLGVALSDMGSDAASSSMILIFIDPSYHVIMDTSIASQNAGSLTKPSQISILQKLTLLAQSGYQAVSSFVTVKLEVVVAQIDNLYVRNVEAEEIKSNTVHTNTAETEFLKANQTICLGETCINEGQLKTLMNSMNMQPTAPQLTTPSPANSTSTPSSATTTEQTQTVEASSTPTNTLSTASPTSTPAITTNETTPVSTGVTPTDASTTQATP
jgi:hypothetical protein